MSKKPGLLFIPVRGWLYNGGGTWPYDDTLTVTGKYTGIYTGCPKKNSHLGSMLILGA